MALHFDGERLLMPGWNGDGVAEVQYSMGLPLKRLAGREVPGNSGKSPIIGVCSGREVTHSR